MGHRGLELYQDQKDHLIQPPQQTKTLFLGEQPPCLFQGCYVTNVFPAQIYKFQMKVVCLSTQIIFHWMDREPPKGNTLLSTPGLRTCLGTIKPHKK